MEIELGNVNEKRLPSYDCLGRSATGDLPLLRVRAYLRLIPTGVCL